MESLALAMSGLAMLCYSRIFVGQRVLNVTYDLSTIKLDLESNKQKL